MSRKSKTDKNTQMDVEVVLQTAEEVMRQNNLTREELTIGVHDHIAELLDGAAGQRLVYEGIFELSSRLLHAAVLLEDRCALLHSIGALLHCLGRDKKDIERLFEHQINHETDCGECTACREREREAANPPEPNLVMYEERSKVFH